MRILQIAIVRDDTCESEDVLQLSQSDCKGICRRGDLSEHDEKECRNIKGGFELMALIKCDGISIAYEGQTVVRDLSFWIEQGDYLCIVGENGSGKSTLVKSLLGLKPPFKGQILLGDGLKQDEIGYLPQQTVVQKDFPASVYEVVLSGRLNSRGWRPFYSAADKKAARENMELLGIREMETPVTSGIFPADRNRGCCWRERCVPQRSSCC